MIMKACTKVVMVEMERRKDSRPQRWVDQTFPFVSDGSVLF